MSERIHVQNHGSLGLLWFIGWLFSIGFLKLGFWKGFLALFVWPYFLGAHLASPERSTTQAPVERPIAAPENAAQ
ncbi:MAG: hypothetical protein GC206_11385 [Alphaproteobacteria bacterium]|nr:hypothetical protein [Alphaproteobacteria bacterium]